MPERSPVDTVVKNGCIACSTLSIPRPKSVIFIVIVCYKDYHNYKYEPYVISKDFDKIELDNYDKLMIVAHPDDETLWGGAHLLEDNYLVVCITCGPIKDRVNEFISEKYNFFKKSWTP